MNIHISKILVTCLLFTVTALVSQFTFAEVVVIVNAKNSNSTISKSDLGRIFLGKADSFSDGSKATPINQIFASEARKEFDNNLLNKSSNQIKAYWSKQMFSGNGIPPKEYNGDLDVLQYVSADIYSIGYIDRSAVNASVKVIKLK